ncbi:MULTISPECIES: hypothetical protein, partial [unclassified Mucilaginibacter]|uniref:hypothetical protein n=1 Tax=unclassified Mucilaginibacter TaxID=2617802 RepID=UPI002B232FBA
TGRKNEINNQGFNMVKVFRNRLPDIPERGVNGSGISKMQGMMVIYFLHCQEESPQKQVAQAW